MGYEHTHEHGHCHGHSHGGNKKYAGRGCRGLAHEEPCLAG